jgi:hypothetical protein
MPCPALPCPASPRYYLPTMTRTSSSRGSPLVALGRGPPPVTTDPRSRLPSSGPCYRLGHRLLNPNSSASSNPWFRLDTLPSRGSFRPPTLGHCAAEVMPLHFPSGTLRRQHPTAQLAGAHVCIAFASSRTFGPAGRCQAHGLPFQTSRPSPSSRRQSLQSLTAKPDQHCEPCLGPPETCP